MGPEDRGSLQVTGSIKLICRSFYWKCGVFQDRWSLMSVASERQVSLQEFCNADNSFSLNAG